MPILFQIDEIEPPKMRELKRKRGRPKKGGASAEQKGRAAELRTRVNENIGNPAVNQCLFKDLSFVVHSGDLNPNLKGFNPYADTENKKSQAVKGLLDTADANIAEQKRMVDAGVKLPKKLPPNCPDPDPEEETEEMKPKKKGPTPEQVEANRQKQKAEKEAKKALKGAGRPIQLWGGKLSSAYINQFVANSYNAKGKLPNRIGDFLLDKSLSGQRAQVYHNPTTGEAVVVHRGSQGIHDWGNNLKYFLGFDLKNSDRAKFALKVQKEAEAKYGAKNISTLGHSIGGKIASDVGGDSKEIITLNRAVAGRDLFKNPVKDNEYSIRTTLDPVSYFLPKNDKTTTIPSTTINPLTEHSTDVVKRLDPNLQIGKGIDRSALARLTKKQIKEIIKALPKIKDGFKLVGKGKPELVDYCCGRCSVGATCCGE